MLTTECTTLQSSIKRDVLVPSLTGELRAMAWLRGALRIAVEGHGGDREALESRLTQLAQESADRGLDQMLARCGGGALMGLRATGLLLDVQGLIAEYVDAADGLVVDELVGTALHKLLRVPALAGLFRMWRGSLLPNLAMPVFEPFRAAVQGAVDAETFFERKDELTTLRNKGDTAVGQARQAHTVAVAALRRFVGRPPQLCRTVHCTTCGDPFPVRVDTRPEHVLANFALDRCTRCFRAGQTKPCVMCLASAKLPVSCPTHRRCRSACAACAAQTDARRRCVSCVATWQKYARVEGCEQTLLRVNLPPRGRWPSYACFSRDCKVTYYTQRSMPGGSIPHCPFCREAGPHPRVHPAVNTPLAREPDDTQSDAQSAANGISQKESVEGTAGKGIDQKASGVGPPAVNTPLAREPDDAQADAQAAGNGISQKESVDGTAGKGVDQKASGVGPVEEKSGEHKSTLSDTLRSTVTKRARALVEAEADYAGRCQALAIHVARHAGPDPTPAADGCVLHRYRSAAQVTPAATTEASEKVTSTEDTAAPRPAATTETSAATASEKKTSMASENMGSTGVLTENVGPASGAWTVADSWALGARVAAGACQDCKTWIQDQLTAERRRLLAGFFAADKSGVGVHTNVPLVTRGEFAASVRRPWIRPTWDWAARGSALFSDVVPWTADVFASARDGGGGQVDCRLLAEYHRVLAIASRGTKDGQFMTPFVARDRARCGQCARCRTGATCERNWYRAELCIKTLPDGIKIVIVVFPGYDPMRENQVNEVELHRKMLAKDQNLAQDVNIRVFSWANLSLLFGEVGVRAS